MESAVNAAAMLCPSPFKYPAENDITVNDRPTAWNKMLVDGDHIVIRFAEESDDDAISTVAGTGINRVELGNGIFPGGSTLTVSPDQTVQVSDNVNITTTTPPLNVDELRENMEILIDDISTEIDSDIDSVREMMTDLSGALNEINEIINTINQRIVDLNNNHILVKEHVNNAIDPLDREGN